MSAPMASTARGVTRVLLLADAPVLRRGLVSMINETAGMQSVGTPGELRRALTLVESARPDAVVVELGSGRAATLNACRDLRRRFPRVAIVALATSEDPAVVNEAIAAGIRGYLMINTSPTLLGWAILAARAGRTVVDPQIRRVEPSDVPAAKPFTPEVPLTRRESDVLDELLQGQSNRQIGRNLFISEDTVKSHVKAILRKLGARDRAHAVSLVLSNRQPGCTCGHGLSAAPAAELDARRAGRRRHLIGTVLLRHTGPVSLAEAGPECVVGSVPMAAFPCTAPPSVRARRTIADDDRPDALWDMERSLRRRGFAAVAGADEAGRGACAGPLVAAACVLPSGRRGRVPGLADSKLLTAAARERVYAEVVDRAVAWSVVVIPVEDLDARGMHVTNIEALRRAVVHARPRAGLRAHRRLPRVRAWPSPASRCGRATGSPPASRRPRCWRRSPGTG